MIGDWGLGIAKEEGEWGMGSGEWGQRNYFPTPHSPLPFFILQSAIKSSVAFDYELGDVAQGAAITIVRKDGQRLLRARRVSVRLFARVVQFPIFAEQRQHLFGQSRLSGGFFHRGAHERGELRLLSQQADQRERYFSFAQIAQNRFAEFRRVRGKIEQVVDQLKRYAETQSVIGERAPLLFVRAA